MQISVYPFIYLNSQDLLINFQRWLKGLRVLPRQIVINLQYSAAKGVLDRVGYREEIPTRPGLLQTFLYKALKAFSTVVTI